MPLSTYAELKTAVVSWYANRDDLPVEDLVRLAEARLNRLLNLRLVETDAALTGVAGSRLIPLPAGFMGEPIALFLERPGVGREPLEFRPSDMPTSAAPGEPEYWSIDGGNLAFERPCDAAYGFILKHLARLALSDAAPANALLTDHPDAYLAACQHEAAKFVRDLEKASAWLSDLQDITQQINLQDHRSRALARLRVDPALSPRAMGAGGYDINSDR